MLIMIGGISKVGNRFNVLNCLIFNIFKLDVRIKILLIMVILFSNVVFNVFFKINVKIYRFFC